MGHVDSLPPVGATVSYRASINCHDLANPISIGMHIGHGLVIGRDPVRSWRTENGYIGWVVTDLVTGYQAARSDTRRGAVSQLWERVRDVCRRKGFCGIDEMFAHYRTDELDRIDARLACDDIALPQLGGHVHV